jgi:predicted lipoprotein with Yx(FWY)xxD motif
MEDSSRDIWPDSQHDKEIYSMKKVIVCLLALTIAMSLTAFAQQDYNAPQTQADQASAKAPLMTLKGTVKADGDKFTFVNDKDGKSWDVMNPEELKGHEGHHVQLSAHVYNDKNAVHIMSVKMLKGDSMSK